MYRSYSYNNMPKPITYRPEKPPEKKEKPQAVQEKKEKKTESGSIFDNIHTDDIILIMVVLALLVDDCEDKLLIAALGFIFLSDLL